ncbi:transposase [Candidatus Symbiobacter mobilis CR]|uniref:Transposase n=1 Tax=Candidatus Symbiobacter mobilis CR TaxID=946483 RepID=U5NAL1_9BURK|nr:transposase [Candidatus Symbiobacter mobilis CR]
MKRQDWIDMNDDLAVTRQCDLVGVSRATAYAQQQPKVVDEDDQKLSRLIDEEYTRHPFYGSRRMAVMMSKAMGCGVNRKRIQRLMRQMGLQGMAPSPHSSKAHPQHPVYPYLLRGVEVTRPNQVWSTDITYIRLAKGFVYLVAVMDWYSRKVLSWRISNSMDASFCMDCLEEALRNFGKPEIFNSDQGSQFTSADFTGVLEREKIAISMDGRGRAFDNIFVERLWRNVKYEDIYLKGYATVDELLLGLSDYFVLYNSERPHQSLQYETPDAVYANASGGGALIIDKYADQASNEKPDNPSTQARAMALAG